MKDRHIAEANDLTQIYGMGDAEVVALDKVSVQIKQGEFTAIMGPSGSGKSTLTNILGCLARPTSGQYILDAEDVSGLNKIELASIRNQKIGYVFQLFNLLPRTTALRNVILPLLYVRDNDKSYAEMEEKAVEMLELVGLENRMEHEPQELSGGQQQRVAIARALVNDPVMIIADEPTGNLDSNSGAEIMGLLNKMNEQGTTIIIVTHDKAIASHSHRTIHLLDGHIDNIQHNGHANVQMKVSETV
ncbi:MAG: ABC transporter ATP-binding protein [Chloroflexota bacterium]